MRKFLLLLTSVLSILPLFSQVTSVQSGEWGDPSTWDCSCVPGRIKSPTTGSWSGSREDVVISSGHNITNALDTGNIQIVSLEIQTGASLDYGLNRTFQTRGATVVNGTFTSKKLTIRKTTLDGSSNISSAVTLFDTEVLSTADITIEKNASVIGTVNNHGNLVLQRHLTMNDGDVWVNESGSSLSIGRLFRFSGTAVLDASAFDNTIVFNRNGVQDIPEATYYNLTLSGNNIKSLMGDIIVNNNITVETDATLDVTTSNFDINVRTNFICNGSFNANEGTVYFTGSGQFIAGNLSFFNVVLENNTIANHYAGDMILLNSLDFQNGGGTFIVGSTLTLQSDASRTARIGEIPAGSSVSGNITVQRYYNSITGWKFIGSPVQGTTLSDWSDNIIMSGFSGSQYPDYGWINAYYVDNTLDPDPNNCFVPADNITNTVSTDKGWWVYTGDSNPGEPTSGVIDVTGAINQGDIDVNINGGLSGFTLVSNPYPSDISWTDLYANSVGLGSTAYIWDVNTNDYELLPAGGGNDHISSTQAFIVEGYAGLLSFVESIKTDNTTDYTFRNEGEENESTFDLMSDIVLRDEANSYEKAIKIGTLGTSEFDLQLDARKLYSTQNVASISSFYNGVEYSYNNIGEYEGEVIVPIKVKVPFSGNNTLYFSNLNQLGTNCITLEDMKTGESIDLTENPTYNFYIEDTVSMPRFALHLGGVNSNCDITLSTNDFDSNYLNLKKSNGLKVNYKVTSKDMNVEIFSLDGRKLNSEVYILENQQGSLEINLPKNLSSSIYIIKIQSGETVVTERINL